MSATATLSAGKMYLSKRSSSCCFMEGDTSSSTPLSWTRAVARSRQRPVAVTNTCTQQTGWLNQGTHRALAMLGWQIIHALFEADAMSELCASSKVYRGVSGCVQQCQLLGTHCVAALPRLPAVEVVGGLVVQEGQPVLPRQPQAAPVRPAARPAHSSS
jgi:hypothetical protein